MTDRYAQLRLAYAQWQEATAAQWADYLSLAPKLAAGFQTYLGCPLTFDNADGGQLLYVSPAIAEWSDESGTFHMSVPEGAPQSGRFHRDGKFYFALRLFLENGEGSFPKDSFWFLFAANKHKGRLFEITLKESNETFRIHIDTGEGSDRLFEHMLQRLFSYLAKADIHPVANSFRVGFMA